MFQPSEVGPIMAGTPSKYLCAVIRQHAVTLASTPCKNSAPVMRVRRDLRNATELASLQRHGQAGGILATA